jgi:hypothetical protein
VGFLENYYITAINEEWRVEKKEKSIHNRVSTFIREMRVVKDLNLCLGIDSNDSYNFVV